MGYSEVLCHLCGVSFNIGRIRRRDEPRDAAWSGDNHPGSFVDAKHSSWTDSCEGGDAGCCVAVRTLKREKVREVGGEEEAEDEDEDEDYEDKEEGDYERYEFEEDSDGDGEAEEEEDTDVDDEDEGRVLKGKTSDLLDALELEKRNEHDVFQPLQTAREEADERRKAGEGIEHIAGPKCCDRHAYNGYRISAKEMRGCCTLQCLVHKNGNWTPEPDDQEWESHSNYFLSGLSDQMPSRDMSSPTVTPARHGVDEPNTDNCVWNQGEGNDVAMPFHPTCFEIFTRASQLHFGRIDIHGLMGWRNIQSDYDDFYSFPRDPAVVRSQEQWWVHERGSEYLAANPVFVPALAPILRSAIHEEPSFCIQNGAFVVPFTQHSALPALKSQDPFLKFPQELTDSIVGYLQSRDIAGLRLSSRAFRQLPISLFRTLLRREMPWLWEAWSSSQPYFWVTTSVARLKDIPAAKEEYERQLRGYRGIIKDEMPELFKEWCDAEPAFKDIYVGADGKEETRLAETKITLPMAHTNWYELYRDITVHWDELKGLQNRRRIWKDVEEIVARIKGYREKGKIVD